MTYPDWKEQAREYDERFEHMTVHVAACPCPEMQARQPNCQPPPVMTDYDEPGEGPYYGEDDPSVQHEAPTL